MNQTRLTFLGGHLATRAAATVCTRSAQRDTLRRFVLTVIYASRIVCAFRKTFPFCLLRSLAGVCDTLRALTTMATSKELLMTDQMAAIHSALLFTHSSSSMNGHCQAHMSYMFIHKGGWGLGGEISGRMGNPGDNLFCVVLSLWGQMPAGLPPRCLSRRPSFLCTQ